MSQSRKRAISRDGDTQESNKSWGMVSSRPLRPIKRRRGEEGSGSHSTNATTDTKNNPLDGAGAGGGGGGGGGKVKRQVWTATAIEAFSEGLCQHGKSFHRILKFMQSKYKKKNDPVIPNLNKDQVRFYYYRTWHKVSALLTDPTQQTSSSANDTKKSKLTKSPCISGGDVLSKERSESEGRQTVAGEGARDRESGRKVDEKVIENGEREGECKTVGEVTGDREGERDVQREIDVGRSEGHMQRQDGEEPSSIVTVNTEQPVSVTAVGEGAHNEGDIPVICGVDDAVMCCSSSSGKKLELAMEGCLRPSQSPQDPTAIRHSVSCEESEGGCEEGTVVTSVMSEEEEGPLDSSMEDLSSSPHVPATAETDVVEVEIKTKEKFTNDKAVSRREGGRGDTVMVNGVRHSLDLVALIAYFKLKKKCQGDHNFHRRLSELVYVGFTTIPSRTKGRRKVQIRLGNCRALQAPLAGPPPPPPVTTTSSSSAAAAVAVVGRGESGAHSEISLIQKSVPGSALATDAPSHLAPPTITLELRPLSSSSWRYVQSLSQNPRLRMAVVSSLTVGDLQAFLQTKWGVGVGAVPDREGEPHSSGGQFLKLYRSTQSLTGTQRHPSCNTEHDAASSLTTSATAVCSCVHEKHGTTSLTHRASDNKNNTMEVVTDTGSISLNKHNSCAQVESHCQSSHGESEGTTTRKCACTCRAHSTVKCLETVLPEGSAIDCQPECKCDTDPSGKVCGTESSAAQVSGQKSLIEDVLWNSASELDCGLQTTMSSLHAMLGKPERLQLLYEVQPYTDHTLHSHNRLRNLLKIAATLGSSLLAHTSQSSPVHSSPLPHSHQESPVVADYIRSLPHRRSPWRSPLSKYRRIKQRSPRKHISPKKLNFSATCLTKPSANEADEDPLNISTPSSTALPTVKSTPLSTPSQLPSPLPSPVTHLPLTTVTLSPLPRTPAPPPAQGTTTPSLSHLLASSHPHTAPSPSSTPLPQAPKTHKMTPPTSSKTQVQQVTLPKASIAKFGKVNLQGLFSTASDTLASEGANRTSAQLRGRGNLNTGLPSRTRLSDLFGLRSTNTSTAATTSQTTAQSVTGSAPPAVGKSSGACVVAATTVPHCASVCVTTGSMPRAVNVQVVGSGKPPTSLLPQTIAAQQQPHVSSLSTTISHSPANITGATPISNAASLPSTSSLQMTSTATAVPITASTVLQGGGIPNSTLALINSMKRNRRSKMTSNKTLPARQIVPRPLPFGPSASQTPSLPTLSPAALTRPPSIPYQTPNLVQQQIVSLLQTLVVQQQQRRQQKQQAQQELRSQNVVASQTTSQQQQDPSHDLSSAISKKAEEILQMQSSLPLSLSSAVPSTAPVTFSSTAVATSVAQSTVVPAPPLTPTMAQPEIPESDIQAAILDNLFGSHTPSSGGPAPSSRVFQTSSDTVDQLLRGLNTRSQSESIQKLSRETACVLPTFARALESSITLPPSSSAPSRHSATGEGGERCDAGEGGEDRSHTGQSQKEYSPTPTMSTGVDESEDEAEDGAGGSLSLSDVLVGGASDDSTFQQLVRNGDMLDGLEFPMDTLSQLPATPPRMTGSRLTTDGPLLSPPCTENDVSIGSLLDFLVSPEKERNRVTAPSEVALSHVDSTFRSLLEESSVDYIQKFRELASQMNTDH